VPYPCLQWRRLRFGNGLKLMLLFPKAYRNHTAVCDTKGLLNNMVSFFLHKDFKAWRNNFVTFFGHIRRCMSGIYNAGYWAKYRELLDTWWSYEKEQQLSMVNDTPNVNTSHVDAINPIRDKLTSEVQVKLELVNTGLENVAKSQKS